MADTAVLRIRVESNGINAARADLNSLAAQSTRTENVVSRLKGVIGTVAAAIGANEVIRYADAWTTVSNKLTNVTKSGETLAEVQARIFAISQQTNSSLEATATLYGRLEPATRGLISSGAELGSVVETINKAMLVSGATSAEAAGSLVQLAQGLGAGALRGEEFNSVNEAAPRLMQAIADSLGVTRGALKAYAAEGKLTSEVVINAMRSQADAIDTEFSRMDKTFEQKGVLAWNNVVKAIGTDGSLKSAVSEAGDLMVGLSENINTVITVGEVMALVYGTRLVSGITAAVSAKVADISATRAQALATAEAAEATAIAATAEKRKAVANVSVAESAVTAAQAELTLAKAATAQGTAAMLAAEAQTASIKTTITLLEEERALEAQRLKAQISDQGRIMTYTRMAEIEQAMAVSKSNLARAEVVYSEAVAAATAQEMASKEALIAAESQLRNAKLLKTEATIAETAAQNAATVSARAASVAITAWNGALALVGGWPGLFMLAGAAIYYCYQQTEQAKQGAIDFANNLDVTTAALEKMTIAQRQATEIDLEKSIEIQTAEVAKAKSEVADLTAKWEQYQRESKAVGLAVNENAEVHQELITKTAELETKEGTLSSMTSKLYAIQSTFARKLDETSVGMQGYGEKLSTVEQIERLFAGSVNVGNQQLKTRLEYVTNLSGKSVFSDSALKEIKAINANAEALKIQDLRLREIAISRNRYSQDTKNTTTDVEGLVQAHMAEWDQQQKNETAERAASKALQASESAASKAATAAKQHAEEVERQKQAIADLTVELKANQLEAAGEGRAAAELTAKHEAQQQGLGNLTQSYVTAKMALHDFQKQQEAKANIKAAADGVDVSASLASLKSFYNQRLISEQEYVTQSAALKEQWKLKLESENVWLRDEQAKLKTNFNEKLIDEQQYNTASQQLLLEWGQKRRQTLASQQASEQTDMQKWLANMKASATTYDGLMSQAFNSFTSNISQGLTDAIFQTSSLSEAVTAAANSFAQSTIQALLQVYAQKVALWALEKTMDTSASASYASQVTGQAMAGVNLAGINAYASAAAIPVTGWTMAPAAMAAAIGATTPLATAATAAASSSMLSFDGGGFTGYGSRSGGLDGKGGFYAILHPNETVTDHTKNQPPYSSNTTNNRSTVVNVTQNITTNGKIDTRTSKQIASDTARKQRMVTSRLG